MAGADKDESRCGRTLPVPILWNVLGAQREEEVVAVIFISYAREDRVTASRLADRFRDEGWTVFWDRDIIAGDNWDWRIEAEASRARCVVALRSAASVESTEVRQQALIDWRRHVLLPAFLESVDPPSDFREIHASDLRGWEGGADTPGLADLIHAIASLIGQRNQVARRKLQTPDPGMGRPPARRTAAESQDRFRGFR